jgi:hypothetical protein
MRFSNVVPISLVALLGVTLTAPSGVRAADPPPGSSPISIAAADGPSAIHVSGVAPGAHQLMALLYANFAPDLPTVFLSRRPLVTDAAGRFDAIVPIAPAYFPGTIITVIVQTSAAVLVARGSLIIADPSFLLPAHK